jgi:hypothetical protein
MMHRPEEHEPHSAHRPPMAPPTAFGNVYPTGDIIVAVKDDASARELVEALHVAGFPETDLDILDPAFVEHAAEELQRSRSLLARIGSVLGDEGALADRFLELARAGHPIVLVHAPTQQTLDQARPILARHQVIKASHYGKLVITDL